MIIGLEKLEDIKLYMARMVAAGCMILIVTAILASCSAVTSAVTSAMGMGSKDGISAELHIGDKEIDTNLGGVQGTGNIEVKKGNVIVTTAKITSNIERAENVDVYESPSPLFILLLVLGWVLPTPRSIYTRSKNWITRSRNKR